MEIFDEHMKIIKKLDYEFYNAKTFIKEFDKIKNKKKILITIDDGFRSFYDEAWLSKKNKIHLYFCIHRTSGKKWIYELG